MARTTANPLPGIKKENELSRRHTTKHAVIGYSLAFIFFIISIYLYLNPRGTLNTTDTYVPDFSTIEHERCLKACQDSFFGSENAERHLDCKQSCIDKNF